MRHGRRPPPSPSVRALFPPRRRQAPARPGAHRRPPAARAVSQRSGQDRSRSKPVDANPVAARVECGGAEEAQHRVLRRRVDRLARMRSPGVQRRHHDDRAAAFLQRRDPVLERRGDTPDVDREDLIELVEVELVGVAPRRDHPRVGDHDVKPAEVRQRRPHCRLDLGLRPDVGGEGKPPFRRRYLFEIDDHAAGPGPR